MANKRTIMRNNSKYGCDLEFSAEYCESSSDDLSDDSYLYSDDSNDDSDDYNARSFLEEELLLQIKQIYERRSNGRGSYNPEMAAKNAEELVAEEERERRKAEKRKAKKKRRREKKKEEKASGNKNEVVPDKQDTSERKSNKGSGSEGPSLSSTDDLDDGEEFLDVNSAFVSVAVSKKKKNVIVPVEKSRPNTKKPQMSPDQMIAESERFAVIGYKMASKENYEEAVEYFNKAIRLVHDDHRFFSNRSFCHCHLGNYAKALKDADKAIALATNNPKGYYRRGEALKGLNQFKEAEEAFARVVFLDEDSEDAMQELTFVRIQQLKELGYEQDQASAALLQYDTVQAALQALTLSSSGNDNSGEGDEVFISDEEDEDSIASGSSVHQSQENGSQSSSKANKMDPSNPEGHLSLWVGNVSHEISEKQLVDLFSKFGVVVSVRLLPEKYCAFINFRDKTSPGLAMKTLQNYEMGGERLLIRYPNNPVPEAHQQIIIKKTVKSPGPGGIPTKVTGPVNGDECHFWRTTGCAFGNKCRYKHLKESKGVDKKPWQRAL